MQAGRLLQEAGTRLGRFEARLLLAYVMGVPVEKLIAHPEMELSASQEQAYRLVVQRRLKGEPYAYIAGEQEFFGRAFKVTPDVLIPRPDTELLVETALHILGQFKSPRVLDLGTGSGCIAVTIARENPSARVTGCDISEPALRVAAGNAAGTNVIFFKSRWFDQVPDGSRFELIVSNPPYVAEASPYLADLSYEPKGALVSGPEGMDDLTEIILKAPKFLSPCGWLAVEHGFDQGDPCRRQFSEAGFSDVRTLKDLGGHDRVTLGELRQVPKLLSRDARQEGRHE